MCRRNIKLEMARHGTLSPGIWQRALLFGRLGCRQAFLVPWSALAVGASSLSGEKTEKEGSSPSAAPSRNFAMVRLMEGVANAKGETASPSTCLSHLSTVKLLGQVVDGSSPSCSLLQLIISWGWWEIIPYYHQWECLLCIVNTLNHEQASRMDCAHNSRFHCAGKQYESFHL